MQHLAHQLLLAILVSVRSLRHESQDRLTLRVRGPTFDLDLHDALAGGRRTLRPELGPEPQRVLLGRLGKTGLLAGHRDEEGQRHDNSRQQTNSNQHRQCLEKGALSRAR